MTEMADFELSKAAPPALVPEAWVRTELARHPARPYPMDFIEALFTDFSEIHGDRAFGDDAAMTCWHGALSRRAGHGHRQPEGPHA